MLGVLVGTGPGVTARLDVRGRELSRTFTAPEPSALGALALGTLLMALAAAWARLRPVRT
jgi:hypothetical protein